MRHRIGYGDAGLPDFNALVASDPAIASAWNDVSNQLNVEGAGGQAVVDAKLTFANAYQQIANQPSWQVASQDIAVAAHDYTLATKTLSGAINMAQNLISMGQGGVPPAQIINTFVGTMIGVGVAAGLTTAGIGAIVVAAVGAIVAALDSVGLIPHPSPTPQVCGQNYNEGIPQIVIGCMGAHGLVSPVVDQKSPQWRHFPTPGGWENDQWFQVQNYRSNGMQNRAAWGGGIWSSAFGPRLVDAAWPQFRHLECESNYYLPGPAGDFQRAFFAGWKLNAELALNGQQSKTDAEVLVHVLRIWNTAHEAGAGYTFQPGNLMPSNLAPGPSPCDANYPHYGPFAGTLVSQVQALSSQDLKGGTDLVINTGALKQVAVVAKPLAGASTSTVASTALKLGVYGAGALVAGVGLYSLATKQPFLRTWQRLWEKTAAKARGIAKLR